MKKKIRLTESDLVKLINRIIKEQELYPEAPANWDKKRKLPNTGLEGKSFSFKHQDGSNHPNRIVKSVYVMEIGENYSYFIEFDKSPNWVNFDCKENNFYVVDPNTGFPLDVEKGGGIVESPSLEMAIRSNNNFCKSNNKKEFKLN
jgi:hypothetical protein